MNVQTCILSFLLFAVAADVIHLISFHFMKMVHVFFLHFQIVSLISFNGKTNLFDLTRKQLKASAHFDKAKKTKKKERKKDRGRRKSQMKISR